jgi:glycosyltransferase involved in cell wall biosynthesis
MAKGPLVSILTPSLNQARWVELSLESVRRQSYPRIEQVVIDGGSTDGTLELLRAHENESLRVIERPGTSQAEALNAAFELTSGEIVGWLNTDDAFFGVHAVQTAVAAFQQQPDAGVVYGDAVMADAEGRILRHVSTSAERLKWANTVSPLVQPAVFFRRSAIGDRLISDEVAVSIDYELWLRLRPRTSFVKVRQVLAIDRDYPGRKSRTFHAACDADRVFLADRYGLRETGSNLHTGIHRWGRRVAGFAELLRLEERYDLAFPAVVDARWRRALRQLALPQRWCHVV